ncbi:Alpha/beta fold family hydrolase, partial [Pseudomonas syringae pv. maculicola]
MAFVHGIRCPTQLVIASDGMLAKKHELLSGLPFDVAR